jgi:hypothetical protein
MSTVKDTQPSDDVCFIVAVTCFFDVEHNSVIWAKMNVPANWKCWYMYRHLMKHGHNGEIGKVCQMDNLLN